MPTKSINIGFRPPRIVTLVRSESLADVADAATANSHVWGGIYNPILPVGHNVNATIREVEQFRPDLVTVIGEPTPEQAAVLEAMRHLRGPRLSMGREPFDQLDGGSMPFADARLICRHYHETTFRFGVLNSRATFVEWDAESPDDAYLSVLFGRYRRGKFGIAFRAAFFEWLAASRIDAGNLATMSVGVTPIDLTGTYLRAITGPRETGVVVGKTTSSTALLLYWNLRSVGCDVLFWPIDQRGPLARHARASLKGAVDQWSRQTDKDIVIWSTDGEPLEELRALLSESNLHVAVSDPARSPWGSPTTRPYVWSVRPQAVLGSFETHDTGSTDLVVGLPSHPFSPATDDTFGKPRWLVTLSAYAYPNLGQSTFDIPRLPQLTPWASDEMQIVGDVRLEASGVSVFEDVDATTTTLRLVDERTVIQQLFAQARLTATTSPAGEAAGRIVTQMGGLIKCRKLRLHGVRALLASETRAWTWKQAIHRLHDSGRLSRYSNTQTAPELLRTLIDRGALQAVFGLQCPSCATRSEYRLDALSDLMTCPRCNHPFDPAPLLEQGTWRYRPSGFFANMSSHGSLPVVLTLIRMLETLDMHRLMLAGSQDIIGPDWREECDFVALWRDRAGDPVLAIGECKGGNQPIEESDATALSRIADSVRSIGVECYIVFATTREQFTESELAIFREMLDQHQHQPSLDGDYAGERLGPVLLAADQLDYHRLVPVGLWKELPVSSSEGMAALAANTLAFHLDPATAQRFSRAWQESDLLI